MKRIITLFSVMAICASAYGQKDNSITINPKIGMNFSGIQNEPDNVSTNNKLG